MLLATDVPLKIVVAQLNFDLLLTLQEFRSIEDLVRFMTNWVSPCEPGNKIVEGRWSIVDMKPLPNCGCH